MTEDADIVEFDEMVALGLAAAAKGPEPGTDVRQKLMQGSPRRPIRRGLRFTTPPTIDGWRTRFRVSG